MFRMTSWSPYKGEIKTLKFDKDKDPRRSLGLHRDINGAAWDVYAIVGKRICARRGAEDYDTSSYGQGYSGSPTDGNGGIQSRRYIPYDVELV